MGEPIATNDKWQRMIDAVMADPVRRERLATALRKDIKARSSAAAFRPELAESGERISRHDERVLGKLDRDDPTLMRAFRDMLIFAFDNAERVQRFDVTFSYPDGSLYPDGVVFAAIMAEGRVSTVLRIPPDGPSRERGSVIRAQTAEQTPV